MKTLIEELREWSHKGEQPTSKLWGEFYEILSRHADKVEEPLACLADRKEDNIVWMGHGEKGWQIILHDGGINSEPICFTCPTYAAAEAKAREYLRSLPDTKEKI